MPVNAIKFFSKLAIIGVIATAGVSAAQAQSMSQVHMNHVSESWGDTPNEAGLLPTAIAEAEIAVFHANLAAQQLDNLDWMKTHAIHVMNAIDPSMAMEGPGLGYGVKQAAAGVAKHITIAAGEDDASENVKIHAVHISTSANNTLARVAEMIKNIETIQAATTAAAAAPAAEELAKHANQLLEGDDANGDGEISWEEGEGGLRTAEKHMNIMRAGEDM